LVVSRIMFLRLTANDSSPEMPVVGSWPEKSVPSRGKLDAALRTGGCGN
jgi:hypothetical protein